MKKFLVLCLMIVTIVGLCACGTTTLDGTYTANKIITFEFHDDGTFYVDTTGLLQQGTYKNTDDGVFDLFFFEEKIGEVKYDEDEDVCKIKINKSDYFDYERTEDAKLMEKYNKENSTEDKDKDKE